MRETDCPAANLTRSGNAISHRVSIHENGPRHRTNVDSFVNVQQDIKLLIVLQIGKPCLHLFPVSDVQHTYLE